MTNWSDFARCSKEHVSNFGAFADGVRESERVCTAEGLVLFDHIMNKSWMEGPIHTSKSACLLGFRDELEHDDCCLMSLIQ